MNISSVVKNVKHLLIPTEIAQGEKMFNNNSCVVLSQSSVSADFMLIVEEENKYLEIDFEINEEKDNITPKSNHEKIGWNQYTFACLLQYEKELNRLQPKEKTKHKKYSRQGMIKRVLEERQTKADKAHYRIKWANNIYGDHILTNENGIQYKIFLRDFENETGYNNSADAKLNKLGTTKHIMYAFRKLKENKTLFESMSKVFPFIEIFCDPLNDYKITWHYKGVLPEDEKKLIDKYFKTSKFIEDTEAEHFLQFIEETEDNEKICIRPEVREKIENRFEKLMLAELEKKQGIDFSVIKKNLFPYQIEGVRFALFRKAAIIADEMGLGKTIQAIATAMLKKQILGFRKTLIVCPTTLKSQWKKEIENFTNEKALIVSGTSEEREKQYLDEENYFFIINYETVLRDNQLINNGSFDFLILDEAQKIKNYETKTSLAIKQLNFRHTLVITGTPIENRLIDIFSIISVIDPYFLGPLWEFSYQYCLFNPENSEQITGYYNLNELNEKLSEILIRREKNAVLSQLPDVQQIDIPIVLSPLQEKLHREFMAGVAAIIRKKFLTPYDFQKLNMLLNNARMVCDSTFLIDETTNESPKLEELKDILFEKLDIRDNNRKIIIFSEWMKVHKLIGQILRQQNIDFVELNGKIPVKLRNELIKKFETSEECKVFLSTETGGAGLNLQSADILINFELPWNPAKKSQRIGRIDRLGQKSRKLTIYNLISKDSIEQQISAGLLMKQSLFDGVLSDENTTNYVDFSSKGRSQFIRRIEEFVNQYETREKQAKKREESQKEKLRISHSQHLGQLELFDESNFDQHETNVKKGKEKKNHLSENQSEQMEKVLNSGMRFLSDLFKLSTGTELDPKNRKIEIDKETGEIVMRFSLK